MIPIRITSIDETYYLIKHTSMSYEIFSTAIRLQIFEFLFDDYKSLEQIKNHFDLKAKNRNLLDFFDKLVTLGLLDREGIEETSKYKNSQSNTLFCKNSPKNILNAVKIYKEIQNSMQSFDQILKTDYEIENLDNGINEIYSNIKSLKTYLYSMIEFSKKHFEDFAGDIPDELKECKSIIDVGGALGLLSSEINKTLPEIQIITYDLPIIEPIVKEYLKEVPNGYKIKVLSGDVFKDNLPTSDSMILCNILLDFNQENQMKILKKTYDSLADKGILCVIQPCIENDRKTYSIGLDISLAMMAYYKKGYCYSPNEFNRMASKAGFKGIKYKKIYDGLEYCMAFK